MEVRGFRETEAIYLILLMSGEVVEIDIVCDSSSMALMKNMLAQWVLKRC